MSFGVLKDAETREIWSLSKEIESSNMGLGIVQADGEGSR